MKLQDVVELNPRLTLKKGALAPFIEMAALPTNEKFIAKVGQREVTGSGAKFQNGDTLFARITPCLENGKGGYVAGLPSEAVGQGSTEYIVFRARKKSDEQFVYYLSRYPKFRNFAEKGMEGTSGRQRVTWQTLADFELPDLAESERAALGEVLASLDDKIELNRRMNETLEEMARALFRDWFVDFGPTRRQMEGATDPAAIMGHAFPPEKAATLAPLFPATLGDDGLPEGWAKQRIEDALNRLKVGKLYNQKTALNEGKVPILDQGKLGVIGYHNNEPNIVASAEKRVGIFANHTCVQRLLDRPFSTIQNVIPYRGKELPTEWCHYATLGQQTFEEYKGHWPTFVSKEIVKPNLEPAIAFAEFVDAILLKISSNEQENQTLAEMRDLLLPKLMSGEIRLKDVEA